MKTGTYLSVLSPPYTLEKSLYGKPKQHESLGRDLVVEVGVEILLSHTSR